MTSLAKAVGYLDQGDWQAAHRIVQQDESPLSCWAHGIAHLMEGDLDNAGYWYRRAGRELPEACVRDAGTRQDAIAGEIGALGKEVGRRPDGGLSSRS